jgi:hypothetical protein
MRKIEFSGWMSVDDALKADLLIVSKKQLLKYLLFFAAITVAVGLILPDKVTTIERILVIGATLITLVNLSWIRRRKARKNSIKYYTHRNLTTRRGNIGDDKIEVFTDKIERTFEWNQFARIVRTDTMVLLLLNKTDYLAFAPYMLENEKDWSAFNQLVRNKLY